jgi:hypothetical protein
MLYLFFCVIAKVKRRTLDYIQEIHKKKMPLHRKRRLVYLNVWPFCEKIGSASGAACAHRMHIHWKLCAPVIFSHPQQCALFVLHSAPRSLVILLNYAALLSLFHYYCCSHRALLLLQPHQPALVSPRKSDYGSKSFCTHTHKPLPGF